MIAVTPTTLPKTFEELVGLHAPAAIDNEREYREAMELINALARIPKYTPGQSRYLRTLAPLVAQYERQHRRFDTSKVTVVDILESFMEDWEMSVTDLAKLLGCHKSTASLILSGKRNLTVSHIRKLADRFKVSTDLFIR